MARRKRLQRGQRKRVRRSNDEKIKVFGGRKRVGEKGEIRGR